MSRLEVVRTWRSDDIGTRAAGAGGQFAKGGGRVPGKGGASPAGAVAPPSASGGSGGGGGQTSPAYDAAAAAKLTRSQRAEFEGHANAMHKASAKGDRPAAKSAYQAADRVLIKRSIQQGRPRSRDEYVWSQNNGSKLGVTTQEHAANYRMAEAEL